MGTVEGTVTLDGKPLPSAVVSFHPVKGGRLAYGLTDANGHYQLHYNGMESGAVIGTHKVTINTACSEGPRARFEKEKVPPKFNSKTTLEKEVASGSNTIDLPLTSK